ncbi:MAG: uracil-DNA glycosylase [Deltaproteobacteria bacterium]|nr:uracil-DNA glycosylase [Deltaproteobacteria bacterium]
MIDKDASQSLYEVTGDLRNYLTYMKRLGFEGLSLSSDSLKILDQWDGRTVVETLDMIKEDLGDCRRCKLSSGRKHIVFGAGDPQAQLVLVGEGPGYEEDIQGVPFVGRAGQLLTKILEAIKLTRDDVYICNIIKCRPPKNRNPERDEIASCLPFVQRQIRAIRPKFICALGTFAAQTLLQTKTPISRLRGEFHPYEDILLLPTYHPAYLLRNPNKKRDVWEDVQKLQVAYEKA